MPAYASHFDPQGVFSFDDDAVFTEGFESFTATDSMTLVEGNALEGSFYLRIKTDESSHAILPVTLASTQSAYHFRAFVRSSSSWYPTIAVHYSIPGGAPFSYATMYPTGRMTSDGWVEIASPSVSVDGTRGPVVYLSMRSTGVDLDALEVAPDPGAYVPAAPCAGLVSTACTSGQVCIHGYCRDTAALVPPLPGPAQRSLLVDVLRRKLEVFYGGVFTRQGAMQQSFETLEAMRYAATPWSFWNGLASAVVQLQDAHTMPFGLPNYLYRAGRAFPVCMVEGTANLSHAIASSDPAYADVLVSHVGPDKNLGLKPGDRIVAVDGMHPVEWMKTLVGHAWMASAASDPEVHSSRVEDLTGAIPAFARSIDVIRCNPASGACSPRETILTSSFAPDDEQTVHPACDHRPSYHLTENNPDPVTHELYDVRHGVLADSKPGEDLYGMIWNDTNWGWGEPNPWEDAYTDIRANAKGLILDHRTGNGGTPNGAAYLTELSLKRAKASVWSLNTTLGLFDQPFTLDDGLELFTKWKYDSMRSWTVGSTTPREDMRIAVLLARDVSGSDFFPFGVKDAPNTRMFGRRTMGAFSTFMMFETATFLGWTLASGDFIDPTGAPQIGHGVDPHEEVLPLQSDLLMGRDTAYERALKWVRCGQEGCL